MPIKRSREEMELDRTIVMANYLIHLSQASNSALVGPTDVARVYECKTCNRKFPSFQALGGHRASHKKLKMSDHDHNMIIDQDRMNGNSRKPKSHECSICGLEFPVGQALGGHMRRHRTALNGSSHLPTLSLSLESYTSHDFDESKSSDGVNKIKGTSGHHHDHDHKSVTCLDLNLTPLENGLLEFGKIAPPFVY